MLLIKYIDTCSWQNLEYALILLIRDPHGIALKTGINEAFSLMQEWTEE
ncbi:MAG: hypothetical protein ACD_15C00037G0002 [uncultured bacterium]|nr:MAG: hypothetical protein ACD_15C00037G0002 [uncultured bacterium]